MGAVRRRIGPGADGRYVDCMRDGAAAGRTVGVVHDYALVTAAHDEVEVIDRAIDAVAAQTVRPVAWAIVSDASTDGTDEVVRSRAEHLPWIWPLRVDRAGGRSFAGKARAVALGWEAVRGVPTFAVANLDADVEPPPEYFERCLRALVEDEALGITGGVIVEEEEGSTRRLRSNPRSVPGAIQVFRRACWEDAGGYLPLEGGGEDAVAEVIVRAHGSTVRAMEDLEVRHHGPVLGGAPTVLRARAARGRMTWRIGYHPLFLVASAAARMTEPPVVAGSMAMLAGYGWAGIRRLPRTPPPDVVKSLREDQLRRLRRLGGDRSPGVSTSV
jgi:poly-beta-1,6-N-acetyl-D-glucosamine synthase